MDRSPEELERVERDNKNYHPNMDTKQQQDQWISEDTHPRDSTGQPIKNPKFDKVPLSGHYPDQQHAPGMNVPSGEKRGMTEELFEPKQPNKVFLHFCFLSSKS